LIDGPDSGDDRVDGGLPQHQPSAHAAIDVPLAPRWPDPLNGVEPVCTSCAGMPAASHS